MVAWVVALAVLVGGERGVDEFYAAKCGRRRWDPLAERDRATIYPFALEAAPPAAPPLKRKRPFYPPQFGEAAPAGAVANLTSTGRAFWANCETAFAYGKCNNKAKPVCDAFCRTQCLATCQYAFDSLATLQQCLNDNNLTDCGLHYGTVSRVPVRKVNQQTVYDWKEDSAGALQNAGSDVVVVALNWDHYPSGNFKNLKQAVLQLELEEALEDFDRDPDYSADYSNVVRVIDATRLDAETLELKRRDAVPFSHGDVSAWQRLNLFGSRYFLQDSVYQVDVTALLNANVVNALGTNAALAIWFNVPQRVHFRASAGALFLTGGATQDKFLAQNLLKNKRTLSMLGQYTDRGQEL